MLESMIQSPLHAFGLASQATPIDDPRGVWANELTSLGYVSLRGDSQDRNFVEKATSALGVALPTSPCTFAVGEGVKALWISPDEWLIVSPRDRIAA
jgi:sarcosine oxidase subunit gamma